MTQLSLKAISSGTMSFVRAASLNEPLPKVAHDHNLSKYTETKKNLNVKVAATSKFNTYLLASDRRLSIANLAITG